MQNRTLIWSVADLVRSGKRSEMTLSGMKRNNSAQICPNQLYSTLATDRGFKERVREDMLIRLLDAFVWKNQDNAEEGRLAFGYVQGMNVLAAPFLYTMASEIEAFYTFSKFIEQCCPLYVQPTLDGVHKGLRVG